MSDESERLAILQFKQKTECIIFEKIAGYSLNGKRRCAGYTVYLHNKLFEIITFKIPENNWINSHVSTPQVKILNSEILYLIYYKNYEQRYDEVTFLLRLTGTTKQFFRIILVDSQNTMI